MDLRTAWRRARHALRKDHVDYQGFTLPARHLRRCTLAFHDDAFFVRSAEADAERLVRHCGLSPESRLLDVGSGHGRLAIGILRRLGGIRRYLGLDVMSESVRWCERHITRHHPGFEFLHVDAANSRYNPEGRPIDERFHLPVEDGSFDVVHLYSVFSHMVPDDVARYLDEFHRILVPGGCCFFTTWVEEDVPAFSVNPEGFIHEWEGELHCVRYERGYLESLLREHGFEIDHFEHAVADDRQSAVYARRIGA